VSAHSASSLELGSDTAVLAIGGFMGSDPTPTLGQFQSDVAAGRIHYFIPESFRGDGGGPGGKSAGQAGGEHRAGRGGSRGGTGGEISTWVGQHFTPVTVAGQTWYDLTRPV
jgi:hypothetical protein